MQQELFNSLEMVVAIKNAIRKEMLETNAPRKAGFIKISLVPATKEADAMLGGLSDFDGDAPFGLEIKDIANYEYTYALDPAMDISMVEESGYVGIGVKKGKKITEAPDHAGCVYSWEDFMEVIVRVSGADGHNKDLATKAFGIVTKTFEDYPNLTVTPQSFL